MCGIAGAILFNGKTEPGVLDRMILTLKHRGPDNQNILMKQLNGVDIGFAHARLSIIDLTNAASQPMSFQQFTIVFNGEIYNFKEIRAELEKKGHEFITHSDTEVVLHAFAQWREQAIHQFIGMFAFALLDEQEQKIYFYRDRAGVKPLHYYWDNSSLVFGSELKAIIEHTAFEKKINEEAVGYYFKMGYVPSPLSIYKDTFKVEPGHFALLDLKTRQLETRQYWNSVDYFQLPKLNITYEDAKKEIEQLLISSCNYRMVADVPVGVFLSGGYDSTAVAAILQKDRTEKLKTFTIGFKEGNNEAPFAKETARFIGTDHDEYICTEKVAQDIIPDLPYFFDEPFFDSSAIPTLLVSQFAKTKVTVALSADAGDEIFAGYDSYQSLARNIRLSNKIQLVNTKFTSNLLNQISNLLNTESFLTQQIHYLSRVLKEKPVFSASLIHEGAQSLSYKIYNNLLLGISYPQNRFFYDQSLFEDHISIGQVIDYNNYLPNDILTKVDRATMSVSLEGREPLLDHRLFEFVAQLPVEYKFDGITRKKILKDIVHGYVPIKMMDRPKTGFSLPISDWLRGDLYYLLDEYLDKKSIEASGYLNYDYVTHLLKLFKSQKLHDESIIWKILQFQMWFKKWM